MEEEKESTTYFLERCILLKNYENKKHVLWGKAGSVHMHTLLLPHPYPHPDIYTNVHMCAHTYTHTLDWTSNVFFSLGEYYYNSLLYYICL